jgi:hypothetical protein
LGQSSRRKNLPVAAIWDDATLASLEHFGFMANQWGSIRVLIGLGYVLATNHQLQTTSYQRLSCR